MGPFRLHDRGSVGFRDRQIDVTVTAPAASEPRAGRQHLSEKREIQCPKKEFTRSTPPSTSSAPAAISLRPAPPTRATSSSKSAPTATRSLPASNSWWTRPAASSAPAARSPAPTPARPLPPQPPRPKPRRRQQPSNFNRSTAEGLRQSRSVAFYTYANG